MEDGSEPEDQTAPENPPLTRSMRRRALPEDLRDLQCPTCSRAVIPYHNHQNRCAFCLRWKRALPQILALQTFCVCPCICAANVPEEETSERDADPDWLPDAPADQHNRLPHELNSSRVSILASDIADFQPLTLAQIWQAIPEDGGSLDEIAQDLGYDPDDTPDVILNQLWHVGHEIDGTFYRRDPTTFDQGSEPDDPADYEMSDYRPPGNDAFNLRPLPPPPAVLPHSVTLSTPLSLLTTEQLESLPAEETEVDPEELNDLLQPLNPDEVLFQAGRPDIDRDYIRQQFREVDTFLPNIESRPAQAPTRAPRPNDYARSHPQPAQTQPAPSPSPPSSAGSRIYEGSYGTYTPTSAERDVQSYFNHLCTRFQGVNGYTPASAPVILPFDAHATDVPRIRVGTRDNIDVRNYHGIAEDSLLVFHASYDYDALSFRSSASSFRHDILQNVIENIPFHEEHVHNLINQWLHYVWDDINPEDMYPCPLPRHARYNGPPYDAPHYARYYIPIVFEYPDELPEDRVQFLIVRCLHPPDRPFALESPPSWLHDVDPVWPQPYEVDNEGLWAMQRWFSPEQRVWPTDRQQVTAAERQRVLARERTINLMVRRRRRAMPEVSPVHSQDEEAEQT